MAYNTSNWESSTEYFMETTLQQMKYEIAKEFGVQLGPETSSRANGSVGGEITKRLVMMAEEQLEGTQKERSYRSFFTSLCVSQPIY